MSAWGFMMDMSHSVKLSEHEEVIEKLTKRIEILEEWIRYYEKSSNGENNGVSVGTPESDGGVGHITR